MEHSGKQPRASEAAAEHEARTRALFRSIARERQGYYDAKPGGPPRLSYWQRRMRRIVERILDERLPRGEGRLGLLDAGCGRGDFTCEISARYPRLEPVLGCDFTPELIQLAGTIAGPAAAARVRFAAGDVTALPFKTGAFDATVCLNVLHHIRAQRLPLALDQLARVTARVLLIEIKNANSPYFRVHSKRVEGVAVFPATIAQVRARLRGFGFELVRRHAIFGLVWPSPLVLLHFERAPGVSGSESA